MTWLLLSVAVLASMAAPVLGCDPIVIVDAEEALLVRQSVGNVEAYLRIPCASGTDDDGSGGDKVRLKASGRPGNGPPVEVDGVVFRHYGPPAALAEIRRTGRLRAGAMHYVRGDGKWFRVDYRDVKGIFFTTPHFAPAAVGVFSNDPFLEFTLLPGTAVVQLEPGILLIPGPPGTEIPIRVR